MLLSPACHTPSTCHASLHVNADQRGASRGWLWGTRAGARARVQTIASLLALVGSTLASARADAPQPERAHTPGGLRDGVTAPGGGVIVPKTSSRPGAMTMRFSRSTSAALPAVMSSTGEVFVPTDPAPLPLIDPSAIAAMGQRRGAASAGELVAVMPRWVRTERGFERRTRTSDADGTARDQVEQFVVTAGVLTRVGQVPAGPAMTTAGTATSGTADAGMAGAAGAVGGGPVASASGGPTTGAAAGAAGTSAAGGAGTPSLAELAGVRAGAGGLIEQMPRPAGAPFNPEALAALNKLTNPPQPAQVQAAPGQARPSAVTQSGAVMPDGASKPALASAPRRGPIRRFEIKRDPAAESAPAVAATPTATPTGNPLGADASSLQPGPQPAHATLASTARARVALVPSTSVQTAQASADSEGP